MIEGVDESVPDFLFGFDARTGNLHCAENDRLLPKKIQQREIVVAMRILERYCVDRRLIE